MERLIINVSKNKSKLVKQLLKELGVIIISESQADIAARKGRLLNVSVWTEDDLKVFEENRKAFNDCIA
jgi:hypothetical protein